MSRAHRRQQGIVQNLANQLAQIATGWEISFDGPLLVDEPDVGIVTIDVVAGTAQVNGHDTELGMTSKLRGWLGEELARRGQQWSWVRSATVTIRYTRSATPFDETRSVVSEAWKAWTDCGLLEAVAEVTTEHGDADARSHNDQTLLRVAHLPDSAGQGGEIFVKF